MPQLQKTTQTRKERLKAVTLEDIEDTYRKGYITASDRKKIVREKAHVTVESLLEEKGFVGAIFQQTIQNVQKGWDNLKEAATRDVSQGDTASAQLYYTGLAMWGQIQILTSALNAFGEVTGQVAENMALRAGASPGLARAINIATDIGTGFVPVGVAAKSFAKGVQTIGKARQAKLAAKAGTEAEHVAAKVIGEALEVEVKGARKVMDEAAGTAEKLPGPTTVHVTAEGTKIRTAAEGAAKEVFDNEAELVRRGIVKQEDIALVRKDAIRTSEAIGERFEDVYPILLRRKLANEPVGVSEIKKAISSEVASQAKVLSVKDRFIEDLATFRKQMETVTTTQAHAETAKLANRLGLSLDDLKNVIPGQALDEKQMYAYLKALEPLVDEGTRLAKAALSEGTEQARNVFASHMSELFTISPIFRGAEVTAGRAVEILKETPPMKKLTDMLMGWDPESMAKGDWQGAITTMAEDWVEMGVDADKAKATAVMAQSLWHRFKENGWPMVREAYTNLLLARPLTQVKNMIGNSVAAGNAIMDRIAGAAFSMDKQAGLVGKEGFYLAKGTMLSMGDALKAFGNAYKGIGPEELSKLDYVPHKIPGMLGRIINVPGDTLRGMDNFFKTILRRGSYYAEALRDGVHRGLKDDALTDFVARRVNNPTQTMIAAANDFADVNTFANELGKMGKVAQKGLQAGPLALWFPFMKTPINLAKYAWNRTPGLQLLSRSLYDDILAGGVKADLAIGRLTISNLTAMFLFELAQEGMITGSGPSDPALRRAWLATHQPYSVKTKDGWMPISNTEPGSTTLGMVADFAQIWNQLDEPTAEQAAMAFGFVVMKDLADKTYWKTVGDLIDLTASVKYGEEPGRKLKEVLMSPVTTAVTGGPLVAGAARAIDPIRREARGFFDGLVARTPGYSKALPPMRDGYGDPILPAQAVGGAWTGIVSPLSIKPFEEDRVKKEGDRLQARLPLFPWQIGGKLRDDFDIKESLPEDRIGVELTPQQRDRAMQIYRNTIRHPETGIEKSLLNNPEYPKQTRAMQREMFMNFLSDAKAQALEALQIEDVELGKKILRSDAASVKPFLQEQEQKVLEQQVQETTTLLETLAPEQQENLMRFGIMGSEE